METIRKFLEADRYAARSNIELVSVSPGRSSARMQVQPYHLNGFRVVQGGAIFTLADFAFAAAANSHGTVAVAINTTIAFLKATTQGILRAEAREVSRSFKLGTYAVEITDDQGELIAFFQGTAYRKSDKIEVPPNAASEGKPETE